MQLQEDGPWTKPQVIKMINYRIDTMLISKYFIAITLFNTSLISCNSQTSDFKMNNLELNGLCETFVKAICTKDTFTFYELIDKEILTKSMNEWMQGNQKITQENLFFPFFFVYSPLKIRIQDLMIARRKDKFFDTFMVVKSEMIDEVNTKINLEWVQSLPEAKSQKIELYFRKYTEWKVVQARWETSY